MWAFGVCPCADVWKVLPCCSTWQWFMLLSVKSTAQTRAHPANPECTRDGAPCSFQHSDVTAACNSVQPSSDAQPTLSLYFWALPRLPQALRPRKEAARKDWRVSNLVGAPALTRERAQSLAMGVATVDIACWGPKCPSPPALFPTPVEFTELCFRGCGTRYVGRGITMWACGTHFDA